MLSRIALFATPTLAMAATFTPQMALAADTVVDVSSLIEPVVTGVFTVLGAAVIWVARQGISVLEERTGLELDQQYADRLDDALFRAINFGQNKALDALRTHGQVNFRNELVAGAARYTMSTVPDVLKYFEIDQGRLMDMIEARLDIDLDGDGDIAGSPVHPKGSGPALVPDPSSGAA